MTRRKASVGGTDGPRMRRAAAPAAARSTQAGVLGSEQIGKGKRSLVRASRFPWGPDHPAPNPCGPGKTRSIPLSFETESLHAWRARPERAGDFTRRTYALALAMHAPRRNPRRRAQDAARL